MTPIRMCCIALLAIGLVCMGGVAWGSDTFDGVLIVDWAHDKTEFVQEYGVNYSINGDDNWITVSQVPAEIPITLKVGDNKVTARSRTVHKNGEKSPYSTVVSASYKVTETVEAPKEIKITIECDQPCNVNVIQKEAAQ